MRGSPLCSPERTRYYFPPSGGSFGLARGSRISRELTSISAALASYSQAKLTRRPAHSLSE